MVVHVEPNRGFDERIAAAVAHWMPRLVTAGIDHNDFLHVTSGLETWPEWLPAWVANGDMHAELAQVAEAQERTTTAGEAWNRAALAYHFAKFVWLVDLDAHAAATKQAVDALRSAHRLLDATAERIEIPYGEGASLVGNLRRPPGHRPPLVLLVPGLDSAKEEYFTWEATFLARGLATFSLDGPGQGETGLTLPIEPRYELAVTATLDVLENRDDIDTARIGAVGLSLGGYYAPRAAAYEKRIKAVVGVSGPFDFGADWETLPLPTRETLAHHMHAHTDDEARARASELNLYEAARLIDQPFLAITGRLDRIVPWQQTQRQTQEAQRGEFVLLDDGNHVCNNVPYTSRPLAADWLREALGR
jgi:dipeptidyl aminopeptidase/acylaminoacyl peptidase